MPGTGDIDTVFDVLLVARWLHFAAMFTLFGGTLFWLALGRRSLAGDLPVTTRRTVRLVRVAAIVALISGVCWLAASIANMTGIGADVLDPETIHAFFFETPFGPTAIGRLILLAIVVIVAVTPLAPTPRFAILAAASGCLLFSQAWLGHAAEGGDTAWGAVMIATYALHVLSAAVWIGGLPVLAFALAERRSLGQGGYDLLAQFSTIAAIAVGLVLLSGIANTAFHVGGDLGRLPSSGYGAVLFVKLALVASMLVLAAVNRVLIMPRLRGGVRGSPVQLRMSLGLELVLAILVLGAAALLGVTPPPH